MLEPTNAELRLPLPLKLDWMNRGYLPAVLAVERASYQNAWLADGFVRCLSARNYFGQVAIASGSRLAGFCIYRVQAHRLHIVKLAVDPHDRRRGVGRQLITSLKYGLGAAAHQRPRIAVETHEANLPAQLFFRAMDFRCLNVLGRFYRDTGDAAYLFSWRGVPSRDEAQRSAA